VVLAGGESRVAGQMMIFQLVSDAAGFQERHWGFGYPPRQAQWHPRLLWTWVSTTPPIDPRLAGRRRHCPPASPPGLAGDWL